MPLINTPCPLFRGWRAWLAALALLVGLPGAVWAGGPFLVTTTGQPLLWDSSQATRYRVDKGALGKRSPRSGSDVRGHRRNLGRRESCRPLGGRWRWKHPAPAQARHAKPRIAHHPRRPSHARLRHLVTPQRDRGHSVARACSDRLDEARALRRDLVQTEARD